MANFVACVSTRQTPLAWSKSVIRNRHRSMTICHLANIAMRLSRKLTWNARDGADRRRRRGQRLAEPPATQGIRDRSYDRHSRLLPRRLRRQPADVLLRGHAGLRPGVQALPGVGPGDSRTRTSFRPSRRRPCSIRSPAFPRRPMLVLTGGDPLKRADLFELIRHAVGRGLQVALTPSATPLATFEAFERARAGRRAAAGHQPRRRRRRDARRLPRLGGQLRAHDADAGRRPHARTCPCRSTRRSPAATSTRSTPWPSCWPAQGIAMWSVFFLVPVGRGVEEQRIAPEEYETVFERLWHHAQRQPYAVKTTEAPHYRRFVLQHGGDPLAGPQGGADDGGRAARPSGAAGRRRRQGRHVRQPHRRNLSGRLPAAVLRAVPAGFGGRRLSEPSRRSWPCAIPTGSRAAAASASIATSAAAAAPGRTPSPATTWRPSRIASTCRQDGRTYRRRHEAE